MMSRMDGHIFYLHRTRDERSLLYYVVVFLTLTICTSFNGWSVETIEKSKLLRSRKAKLSYLLFFQAELSRCPWLFSKHLVDYISTAIIIMPEWTVKNFRWKENVRKLLPTIISITKGFTKTSNRICLGCGENTSTPFGFLHTWPHILLQNILL